MVFTPPSGSIYYSHEGDDGVTKFGGHGPLPKYDKRVIAAADCDEANAALGLAMAAANVPQDEAYLLQSVQNDLFDIIGDLHEPLDSGDSSTVRISESHISRIERAIDHYVRDAEDMTGIVFPGGTLLAGLLYHARTVVRRAERSVWDAVDAHPGKVNPLAARYLNRVSPLLFVLFRHANEEHGDVRWVPGWSVQPPAESTADEGDQEAGQ